MGRGQSNIAHSRSANRGRRREGRGRCGGRGRGGLLVDKGEDGIMTDIVTAERTMGRGRGSGRRWLWWWRKRKSTTCGMNDVFSLFSPPLERLARRKRRSVGLVTPRDGIKISLSDGRGGFIRVCSVVPPPHSDPPQHYHA